MAEMRIVVMGGGSVGKSAITVAWIFNHFVESYDPTIEDSYRRAVLVDNEHAMLDILDTAGQEDYSVLRDGYLRTGEAFVLVYDITDIKSFEEVHKFYASIERVKETGRFPLLLVGNKSDLEQSRQVSSFMGSQLASSWGAAFFETSAKTRHNIDEVFQQVTREIRKHRGTYIDPRAPISKKKSSGKHQKRALVAANCSLL